MVENEENFKVTDRRGRPRDEQPVDAQPNNPAGSRQTPAGFPEPDARAGAEREPIARDLRDFFAMLASSALVGLGEATDPDTGQVEIDLDQAREAIDMLLLLRDKTNGNRTEQESQFLDQVLYDLQMRFVEASGREQTR